MSNFILVLNCGSSSVKGAVLDSHSGTTIFSCLAEKLNLPDAFISFKFNGEKNTVDLVDKPHHTGAIEALMNELSRLNLDNEIVAVGHRVVHGGELFKESTIIDEEVIHNIEKCIVLAPLHNPAHLLGIRAAMDVFRHLPHVAVFDTAFHQSMPEHAYMYAIPTELYKKHGVRRYGAHGTSYRYVSEETARLLKRSPDNLALVIAHLGNGASISAVVDGKSRDTSMGLTPLEGLVMGTRSGDIDASIFSFLQENIGLSITETTEMLNKKSGLLGLSNLSNDLRTLEEAALTGHKGAQLAIDVFAYRLAKYIGSMTIAAGRLDALVFTGGIGENSKTMRSKVMSHLSFLGLYMNEQANSHCCFGEQGIISSSKHPLALVIPTNEELMIAKDTARLTGVS